MSTIPVMPYVCQAQNIQRTAAQQQPSAPKAREAFEGEAQALKNIYDNYMKNVGGFQNINGQMVHVTTVLHTDKNAQQFVMTVEKRLRELGVLPELPQYSQVNMATKQLWTNPADQYPPNA